MKCIHCNGVIKKGERFCDACGKILPPSYKDYFDCFGIKETPLVDKIKLEEVFLRKMKDLHPDRFINNPSKESKIALEQSSYLNKAFDTLSNENDLFGYIIDMHKLDNSVDAKLMADMWEYKEELLSCSSEEELLKIVLKTKRELLTIKEKLVNTLLANNYNVASGMFDRMKFLMRHMDDANKRLDKYGAI